MHGADGVAEQDPWDWLNALECAIRVLHGRHPNLDVAAVGLTGQMAACLPVDASGAPVRPAMIWADQRARVEALELADLVDRETLYALTGNRASPMYLGPKVRWLKRHEPDNYRRASAFIQAQDFITSQLTGVIGTDISNASCSGLFDASLGQWSEPVTTALGIDASKLAPIYRSTAIAGGLREGIASKLGLKMGTPVVWGGGDGPSTAVGLGVMRAGDGYVHLGSSAWVAFTSGDRYPVAADGVETYLLLDSGLSTWTASMHAAGISLEWAARTFFSELPEKEGIARLAASTGDRDPLLFLPYLLGERAPYWDDRARGAFIGLTPRHTTLDLGAAVLEGIALHIRLMADTICQHISRPASLTIAGGGVKVAPLIQAIADALNIKLLELSDGYEASSRGAFASALVGIGARATLAETVQPEAYVRKTWTPEPSQSSRFEGLLPAFRQSYHGLKPIFHLPVAAPATRRAGGPLRREE